MIYIVLKGYLYDPVDCVSVMSHIGWGGEQITICVETFPY